MTEEKKKQQYRILSFDGSYIFDKMHPMDGTALGVSIRNEAGKLDPGRFLGFLDVSIETMHLEKVYGKHRTTGDVKGRFKIKLPYSDPGTTAVINVSFDYAQKTFNERRSKNGLVFVRSGYTLDYERDLADHVCVRKVEGKELLIAIEIPYSRKKGEKREWLISDGAYSTVKAPLSEAYLDGLFVYDAELGIYRRAEKKSGAEREIPSLTDRKEIRRRLYEEGFDCDGVHYVRYKRSAGSSREGHCLFIAEPLYADMMEWTACGLHAEAVQDMASWEAYISLTLSSIEHTVHIPKKAILLLRDAKSSFEDTVVAVESENNRLVAEEKRVTVENTIWDGEALLDESVFEENGYAKKGMMLLRNRFFKTCAFNTKLQKWFADHGITQLRQLNGYHFGARSIEDIKLVITESSLKYLKMLGASTDDEVAAGFKQWLDQLDDMFGVVKTDKKTAHLDGKMVRTNYQLINTVALNKRDVEDFLAPSMEYLQRIQSDPVYMRHYINYLLKEEKEDEFVERDFEWPESDAQDALTDDILNYRKRVVLDLLGKTDRFARTKFYSAFRADIKKAFCRKLQAGKVLVNGTYATLFGNGAELLHAVIDKEYTGEEPRVMALHDGEVYTSRFEDGRELVCARSPHITMGNLLLAVNRHVPIYREYFNLTPEIVCVNAIESNIQQRLNGCDYDSDTMLVTDNRHLLDAAGTVYGAFAVPFCAVKASGKTDYEHTKRGLADMDIQIAENHIGEIVNLSQFLNSLFWNENATTHQHNRPLYYDICKLAVLSGMEIDKAKRMYPVDARKEIDDLDKMRREYLKKHPMPRFYKELTASKREVQKGNDALIDTPMEYLFTVTQNETKKSPSCKRITLRSLLPQRDYAGGDNDSRDKKDVIEIVQRAAEELRGIQLRMHGKSHGKMAVYREEMAAIVSRCFSGVAKKIRTEKVLLMLVDELDKEESKVSECSSLLLAAICNCELKDGTNWFYNLIEAGRNECIEELVQDENGSEKIYGIGYTRQIRRLAHKS